MSATIDDAVVVVRLVLAAVLALSAMAKLLDRPGTERAATELGVPQVMARRVPVVLPFVEGVLAAALWPVSTAAWSAAAILLLLAVFTALVGFNLAKGRHPDCHCFGAVGAAPIGLRTVLRNLALMAAAGFVAISGNRPDADIFAGSPLVDVVAFVGLCALCVGVARGEPSEPRHVEASAAKARSAALQGPAIGAPAADFELPDVTGRTVSLAMLREPGLPVVLIFGHLGCPSCTSLLPDVERWRREHADAVTVAFVVSATMSSAQAVAEVLPIDNLLVQEGRTTVTELYGNLPAPSAVVVAADGTIAEGPAFGPASIRELVDRLVDRPFIPYVHPEQVLELLGDFPVPSVGSPMPRYRLPSTAGIPIRDADLAGGTYVYVFTQRNCAPCAQVFELLVGRPDLAQRSVVVSSGFLPPLPPLELTCPVLDDRLGLLAASLGVEALPSGLVVSGGVVSSPLAVGPTAILQLLIDATRSMQISPDDITEGFVPRPRGDVVTFTAGEATVLGDPSTGAFQTLDRTGELLWSCFDGTESLAEVAEAISDELGAPRELVLRDALAFARQLGSAGVLDGVGSTEALDRTELQNQVSGQA